MTTVSRRGVLVCACGLAAALGLTIGGALAQDEPIYGSQLMSEQEQAEHRARMRAASSDEERAQLRQEHHDQMQERARQMGVTLPEEPPAGGMGQGRRQGMGRGSGAGMGQGMGTGSGQPARRGGGRGGG